MMRLLQFTCLSFFVATFVDALSRECPSGSFACPACNGTITIQVKDCLKCDGFLQTDLTHNQCFNRRLFKIGGRNNNDEHSHYHFWWNDIVGAIIWFVTAGVAISCGVGGGGVYVPMGILVLQFAPKPAAGLSQASIFGACIGGLILNTRSRHPQDKIRHDPGVGETRPLQIEFSSHQQEEEEKEYLDRGGVFYTRPVIDYDMLLFLSPLQIAGAVLGVLIQKLLPNWLYLMTAGILLAMIAYMTFQKYKSSAAKEQKKKRQHSAAGAAALKQDDTPHSNEKDEENKMTKEMTQAENNRENDLHLQARIAFLQDDMRQYPLEKISAVFLLWCGLVVLSLMMGGKEFDSVVGIDCQSSWYGILIVCQFLWLLSFAVWYALQLLRGQATRKAVQYPFLKGDVVWNHSLLWFYGGSSFVAGSIGGLIGVGGASILGPLMLVMGIHPSVSTAINATMVVMTSSSVAVMYIISGLVPLSCAVFYFCVCAAGAVFGKSQIDAYVKRTGRTSLLILILAGIIAFATVGCFAILLMRLEEQDWCLDGFNQFCDVVTSDEEKEDVCSVVEK